MKPLEACRLCLSVDVRMCAIVDTPLQVLYEKITEKSLQNVIGKPIMACYVCRHMLQKSRTFFEKSRKADELLHEILDQGLELTLKSISTASASLKPLLAKETAISLSVGLPEATQVYIKEEPVDLKTEELSMDETEPGHLEEEYKQPVDQLIASGSDMSTLQQMARPGPSKVEVMPYDDQTDIYERDQAKATFGELELIIEPDHNKGNISRKSEERLTSSDMKFTVFFEDRGSSTSKMNKKSGLLIERRDSNTNLKGIVNPRTVQRRKVKRGHCEVCGTRFKSAKLLEDHVRMFHSKTNLANAVAATDVPCEGKPYSCSLCGKAFSEKRLLRRHITTHTGEKPHRCEQCGKTFSQLGYLKKHFILHSGDRPFSCNLCGKAFSQKSSVETHLKIHTGEKPFGCNYCGKTFSQKRNLERHINVHTGAKPHVCKECGKAFSDLGNLGRHIKIHTGEKPYACKHCGQAFSDMGNLGQHQAVHTGEKPYSCNQCGKKFSQKGGWKRHIVVHTGQKPYHCRHCGKAYSDKRNLIRHLTIHTGEEPYPCNQCGKAFSRKGTLERHIKTHTGEKPHRCDVCNEMFSRKDNLLHHLRKHTGENPVRSNKPLENILGL